MTETQTPENNTNTDTSTLMIICENGIIKSATRVSVEYEQLRKLERVPQG
jgi:hypothetical protein